MADLAAVAKRLIDREGRDISIVKLDEDPADPTKPWRSSAAPRGSAATAVAGKGVFVPLSGSDLGLTFTSGDEDSTVCLFPGSSDGGNQLEDFDEIIDGSQRWRIAETQVLQPGATRLLYAFLVQR